MTLIKPYTEMALNEVLIPLILPTHEEISVFADDPIEMIRLREDETPPSVLLLQSLCMYQGGDAKARLCFLFPFLTLIAQNLTTYSQQQTQNLKPDWRIKKALLSALGHLN